MPIPSYDLLRDKEHADGVVGGGLKTHQVPIPAYPAKGTFLKVKFKRSYIDPGVTNGVNVQLEVQKHLFDVSVFHQ